MTQPLDQISRDWSKGNCYYVTLQFLKDSPGLMGNYLLLQTNSEVILVHGQINPSGSKPINHAWIEINNSIVIDHANNYGWVNSKEKYYAEHNAHPVRRFTRQDADAVLSYKKNDQGELMITYWGDLTQHYIEKCKKANNPSSSVFSTATTFTDPSDPANQNNLNLPIITAPGALLGSQCHHNNPSSQKHTSK